VIDFASGNFAVKPSMNVPVSKRILWTQAFQHPSVWRRALTLGVAAGVVQAAINQGDRWLDHSVDGVVFLKTVLSPLISFTLVLFSSAVTWMQRTLERNSP
jgi:hypothetical protein